MPVFENTATIFEMLWDIALAYFVIRLGTIYALLAFSSFAAIGFVSALAARQQPLFQMTPLLPAVQLASVVACALFINTYHDIPKDWRLRAGVGGVGALLVSVAATALKPAMMDMEIGRGHLACVAAMPILLTVLERRPRRAERDGLGLLYGNEKMGF